MTGAAVLRVLNGRLSGTEKPLPESGTLSIGHQFWQDVVIRDPATKGIAVDFAVDAEGSAQITVLSGEAQLLGSTLAEGQTALLPPYVPFSIGGIALAWGDPESARWSDAGGLARSTPMPPPMPPTPADQAVAMIGTAGGKLGALLVGKRLVLLAAAAVMVIGVATVPTLDALGLRGDDATRVDRALERAGLPALQAASNDGAVGGVVVSGVVATEADRVKAQEVLRDSYIPGTVTVQTSGELAQAAADVARIHGLQAVARPISRTGIELRTTRLADDERAKLTQAVRSDVRQVGRIVLRDDLPPQEDTPLKTVADATKKVSTVVAGDPAYIQTVDGARYFSGAMMPSGHRLIAIQGNTVFLEKNGRETRLNF